MATDFDSLLKIDYKLASKVATERLKKVITSIVHQDQTCGVVCCSIFSNLHAFRNVLDMIDKTKLTKRVFFFLSIGKKLAFINRVDQFMLRVLQRFDFSPSFCHWVKLFQAIAFSRILVNGSLPSPDLLQRGVRHGCLLLLLLYVLVSEVLPTRVCKCRDIECCLLPGAGCLQYKISQYADDATSDLTTERLLCWLTWVPELS